jgi:nucleoside-diphosphate-sugar epimerase
MTVRITGGAGHIGSHLVHALLTGQRAAVVRAGKQRFRDAGIDFKAELPPRRASDPIGSLLATAGRYAYGRCT